MDTKEPLFLIPSEQDFHNVPYKFPKKRNNNSPKLFESYFKSIEYSDNEEETTCLTKTNLGLITEIKKEEKKSLTIYNSALKEQNQSTSLKLEQVKNPSFPIRNKELIICFLDLQAKFCVLSKELSVYKEKIQIFDVENKELYNKKDTLQYRLRLKLEKLKRNSTCCSWCVG